MPDRIDPYKVLQVDREAEDEVIQAAYRRLARKYHPDLAETPEAAARMSSINAAWEMIGDPTLARAYDRGAGRRLPRAPAACGDRRPADRPAASLRRPRRRVRPDRRRPTSSRVTGRPAAPPRAAGSTSRCARPRGHGAAGPPPGRPSGTVLNFGRYAGWSLGEVARHDIEYIEWLDRAPIGRNYRAELDEILRSSGRRRSADGDAADRRGLYRRR